MGDVGARAPLIGRLSEMRQIGALVASAAGGAGGTLLLTGEAGIGKTRLLDEALDMAAGRGMLTLRARAEELERRRPFGAMAACLGITPEAPDPRRQEIGRLLFGGASGPAESFPAAGASETELRLVEAMVVLVEDLCAHGPVAVALDDLQWADMATLHVLHRLGRSAGQFPLLLCGAFRPSPAPPELTRLRRGLEGRGATALTVPPLEAPHVTRLLAAGLGAAPGPRLVQQAATAGGNPFFVSALVAALRASGSLDVDATTAEIGLAALPTDRRLTVLLRLSFLSWETQEALGAAALLGCRLRVQDLALVLGTTVDELAPRVGEAIEAGVLTDVGPRLAFVHDLLREAVYDDIPVAQRMTLHVRVARVLAGAGVAADALQIAEHFVRGATRGDAMAVEWLRRAADEAMLRAPAVAADLLERAVALSAPDDPGRDALLADWVVCLEASGRPSDVEAACVEVLGRPQPPGTEARLRLCLARLLNWRGEVDEALHQASLAASVEGLSPVQRAGALGVASTLALFPPRLDRAEALAREGLRIGEEHGDAGALAGCAYTLATVAFHRGQFRQTEEWGVRSRAGSGRGWRHVDQAARLLLSQALLRLDRADEAGDVLRRTRQAVDDLGFRSMLADAQSLLVAHGYELGEWEDAVTEFDALVDLCAELDERPFSIRIAAGARALIALHRGDAEAAGIALPTAAADTDGADASDPSARYESHLGALARALLAESTGSPTAALEALAGSWDTALASGAVSDCFALGPDLVRLARAGGQLDRAGDVCRRIEEVVAANPGVATIRGTGLRCRGLLDDDPRLLVEAVAAFRDGPRPLDLALACEEAADALGRSGHADTARPLFEQAIRLYDGLDAAWDAARATARMQALGVVRVSRPARARPRTGWEALTRGETAVVELVAEGLTNPEVAERLFLSRHTVKRHLANAMLKLGLTSRVELAREASRRNA